MDDYESIKSAMNMLTLFAFITGVIQIILIGKFIKLCETVKNMYIYIVHIEEILNKRLKNKEPLPPVPSASAKAKEEGTEY